MAVKNLGKVRGTDATINGQSTLTITGSDGVELEQSGSNIDISAPGIRTHIENTSNPHNVTAEHIGLSNVENKSSETIRSEITKENITNALGYTPVFIRPNLLTNWYFVGGGSHIATNLFPINQRGKSDTETIPSGGYFWIDCWHRGEKNTEDSNLYLRPAGIYSKGIGESGNDNPHIY